MSNPLTRKLELFGPLSDEDKCLLDDTVSQTHRIGSHQDIIQEGDSPDKVHLVLSGFACRNKMLENGNRQIFAYLVPGDFCDLNVFILKAMDHSLATLSPCTLVHIPRERILELSSRPNIGRALWWATLVDEATLREWLVNLGQRDAATRIAHLFCELHLRLKSIGLADGGRFELPLTQAELGDTEGLSAVHVNRTLQDLRSRDLITFGNRQLVIPDLETPREFCGFNPNYLHLEGGKRDQHDVSAT